MPRTYKLTWQPGSSGRPGRWRKKYHGRAHYFDGGRGKTDRDAYDTAVADWDRLKTKLDDDAPKPHQEAYHREIARWESVLAWSNKHGDASMSETTEAKLKELRQRLDTQTPAPIQPEDTFDGQFVRSIRAPQLDQAIRDVASSLDLESAVAATSQAEVSEPSQAATPRATTFVVPVRGVIDRDPLDVEKVVWNDRLKVMQGAHWSRLKLRSGHSSSSTSISGGATSHQESFQRVV